MNPTIKIEPSECLVDEDVRICIHGLRRYQEITIHALLSKQNDVGTFESFANYTANANGNVDVTCLAAVGGSYTGIEQMGLFSNMKSTPDNRLSNRLLIRGVEQPASVSFRISDSHLGYSDLYDVNANAITEASIRLWYKSPGVTRISVHWKRVHGTLFIPEGTGPYPAVIDLFGLIAGLFEYRASLFASKGYVSLALAYYGYNEIRPKPGDAFDLEYFEEAKEFLKSRPEVIHNKIGIVGNSFGGLLALACLSYIPGFKCAVSISGPVFPYGFPLRYKGRIWEAKFWNHNLEYQGNGDLIGKYCYDENYTLDVLRNSRIEFEKCDKPILFIFGHDDAVINVPKVVSFTENLVKASKGECTILIYPGAGHIFEPPHFPHIARTYSKERSLYLNWGGEWKKHGRAQKLAWTEITKFLQNNLVHKTSNL